MQYFGVLFIATSFVWLPLFWGLVLSWLPGGAPPGFLAIASGLALYATYRLLKPGLRPDTNPSTSKRYFVRAVLYSMPVWGPALVYGVTGHLELGMRVMLMLYTVCAGFWMIVAVHSKTESETKE